MQTCRNEAAYLGFSGVQAGGGDKLDGLPHLVCEGLLRIEPSLWVAWWWYRLSSNLGGGVRVPTTSEADLACEAIADDAANEREESGNDARGESVALPVVFSAPSSVPARGGGLLRRLKRR